jgi:predicted ATPase
MDAIPREPAGAPMIKTFRARNYGCLLDVTAQLTPLHAFIGPNDSGKSTLLHGMRTVVQLASGKFSFDGGWRPFDPFLPITNDAPTVHDVTLGCGVDGGWYAYEIGPAGPRERVSAEVTESAIGNGPAHSSSRLATEPSGIEYHPAETRRHVVPQLASARLVRFDPDALRKPSGLIPESESVEFIDERGLGLPGVYFALRNLGDDVFPSIVDDVRRHFQTIKGLRVKVVTSSTVELEAELRNGARVGAERMSEGLLYYLAFAALRHLQPASLLLVEEPENGLHPARIAEVVKILRTIVKETGTQVVMATHSPLVINELQPEEVSVVTRTEEAGTKVTPITETHNFEKRSGIYALGELWLSYSNGVDEEPLLHGREAP